MSLSQLTNISVFQPKEVAANSAVTLPTSFVALKNETSSARFPRVLRSFLQDKEQQTLGRLRGSAAADVADFLDEVRKPIMLNNHPDENKTA